MGEYPALSEQDIAAIAAQRLALAGWSAPVSVECLNVESLAT